MFWNKVQNSLYVNRLSAISGRIAIDISEGTRYSLQLELYTGLERVVLLDLLGDAVEET